MTAGRPPGAEVFASHYENHKFATFGLILNAFIQEALGKVGNGYTVKVKHILRDLIN